MDKQTVVVLFGGRSSEHSISSATAGGVLGAIDRARYAVIPVGITREGAFVLEEDDPAKFPLDAAHLPEVVDNGTRVMWPEPGGDRTLRVVHPDGAVEGLGVIDVVLPLLHGLHGEDGAIQGFFEVIDMPYAGCGILDSAISLDKHFTKLALTSAGIAVSPGFTVRRSDWRADPAGVRKRVAELAAVVFVKPSSAGSSVGVSRVDRGEGLDAAFELAFAEDDKVLVEARVEGREIEVGVLAGRGGERARASLPGEIVLTTRDFYDFEGKYLGGEGVDIVCPAEVEDELIERLRETAVRAFEAVDGKGLARVDFFVTPAGDLIVNELNTMPGFTPISMFPKCWVASGLSYGDLITELVEAGLHR
ncbi:MULTISPECIES: D-alanine--D-alanine ligase family protein [unclassified Microbacterium]|uniref:D-alanine--D-alanine ligase family protein n=1 Tax=unclassified Microbacterium TaxID=2609290 RepID=UPI000EA963B1|nr:MULTISPECIES: D-alanine--D-alanine ligase family protein [unclassified Microbacterium]MBT2485679.1 D-alanine--D-alanine ligase [Microbacterium sp. ISL-108]RKN68454.1 D-alanine--D-alanine ligase [Microbacterium sp. CGR2]